MAIASVRYQWASGDEVDLVLDSGDDTAHPDLLDELVARVLVMYREICVGDE